MEGESVFHGDRSLPSIVGSLDFFHSKGRMMDIREKQCQLFLECKTNFNREGLVLFFEAVTETIAFYSSNHLAPSSAVWNVGECSFSFNS